MHLTNNPQKNRQWAFRGFLIGVGTGFVFGLLSVDIIQLFHGPTRAAISGGWGLAGGMLGLLIGVAYDLFKRHILH
jgi:hypothetical protein